MLLGDLLLWHLRLFICKLSAPHGTALNTPSTQSSRCLVLLLSSPVCCSLEVVVSGGGDQPLHLPRGLVRGRGGSPLSKSQPLFPVLCLCVWKQRVEVSCCGLPSICRPVPAVTFTSQGWEDRDLSLPFITLYQGSQFY